MPASGWVPRGNRWWRKDTHTLTLDDTNFEDNTFFEIKNGAIYSNHYLISKLKQFTIRVQAEDLKWVKLLKNFEINRW
jgi:hypothetical protein